MLAILVLVYDRCIGWCAVGCDTARGVRVPHTTRFTCALLTAVLTDGGAQVPRYQRCWLHVLHVQARWWGDADEGNGFEWVRG